eukprot:TRINITY_DN2415_c1_g1_i2.p2 TRINITY_DN2415_c1_g1~~TRINITY_DN2415_c1_g1_i2.p2  ORF type:complete len:278 (-),score=75.71 TRINITY_DN2415_c1_g1_i2:50-883(-)
MMMMIRKVIVGVLIGVVMIGVVCNGVYGNDVMMEEFGVAEGRKEQRTELTVTKGMKGQFGQQVLELLNGNGMPTVITEQHHEVLRYWMAMSNEGHFDGGVPPNPKEPRKKVTVFHFDSHPDMAYPTYFKRRWPKNVNWLHKSERIQINNYIPAAIWMGLVDRVIWVRPEWSHQFKKDYLTDQHLSMGRAPDSPNKNKFRINMKEDYFLDYEGKKFHWMHPNFTRGHGYFEDPVEFKFRVVPLDQLKNVRLPNDTQVVIDIDEGTGRRGWMNDDGCGC